MILAHLSFLLYDKLSSLKSRLFSLGGFDIYVEFNDLKLFSEQVREVVGASVFYDFAVIHESFPQIITTAVAMDTKTPIFIRAGGSDFIKDKATIKAKGEFLERISIKSPVDLVLQKDLDLDEIKEKECFARSILGLRFKKKNYKNIYFSLNYPYIDSFLDKERKPTQITTNGCAGHFDVSKAITGALLELVQRDAFLMYWLNSISPKKIRIHSYQNNISIKKIIDDIKKYNLECYFLDTTSDIEVPTCTCVIVANSPTGKRVALGSGSGFSIEATIVAAYFEAVSIANFIYKNEPFLLKTPYTPFSDFMIGRDERLKIYTTDEMFNKFSFFISSKEEISLHDFITINQTINVPKDDHKAHLAHLKQVFKERYKRNKEYDVFVYQIHNKLIDTFGYKVVRVMCDGLYSLYLNENFGDPNHPRLKEFLKNKGLEKVAKLNIWPHPFP